MRFAAKSNTLNVILGLFLAGVVGLVGLWAVFTDLHPGEPAAKRIATIGFVYLAGAAAIGALVPRWWYLAALSAWGPFLMGLLGLISKILNPEPVPYWSFLGLALIVVPAVALISGYVGARLRSMATTAPS